MLVKKTVQIDGNNLKNFLDRSFSEFNISERGTQESVFAKYSTELANKSLTGLELFEGKSLVASATTVYHHFYSNCGLLKLSFLTQVVVQEKFRGQGYLGILIDFAKEVDEVNSSLASIVIARRKVGDLYAKFGYTGFGVFPNVNFDRRQVTEPVALDTSQEWELMASAYINSYQNLPGSIYRSVKYWNYLDSEISKGRYDLGVIKVGNELGYFIYLNGECFELAATNLALFPDLVAKSLSRGVHTFKIGSNHPAFESIQSAGGVYSVRPEPREGHMLKPYAGGEFLSDYLEINARKFKSELSIKEMFSIDINLLNQW